MSDWIDTTKFQYERQLLGNMLEVSHMAVGEILKPDNLTNYKNSYHRKIYELLCSFRLSDTCNLLTATVEFRRKYGQELWTEGWSAAYYITGLASTCHISDPRYYALFILELDIRKKIMQHLKEQEGFMNQKERYEESNIYKQCFDLLDDPEEDLFDAIDQIDAFIAHYAPEEHIAFEKFKDALPKIADRIKDMVNLKMGLAQLQNLYKSMGGSVQQERCMMATEVLIASITRADLTEDFEKLLLKTYKTL